MNARMVLQCTGKWLTSIARILINSTGIIAWLTIETGMLVDGLQPLPSSVASQTVFMRSQRISSGTPPNLTEAQMYPVYLSLLASGVSNRRTAELTPA